MGRGPDFEEAVPENPEFTRRLSRDLACPPRPLPDLRDRHHQSREEEGCEEEDIHGDPERGSGGSGFGASELAGLDPGVEDRRGEFPGRWESGAVLGDVIRVGRNYGF